MLTEACQAHLGWFCAAKTALDKLNYKVLNGQAIRIMWSQRDPNLRKTGMGNIFVKVRAPCCLSWVSQPSSCAGAMPTARHTGDTLPS